MGAPTLSPSRGNGSGGSLVVPRESGKGGEKIQHAPQQRGRARVGVIHSLHADLSALPKHPVRGLT